MTVSFFTPVQFQEPSLSRYKSAVNAIEDYFDLSGRKVVIFEFPGEQAYGERFDVEKSFLSTALKVISYFTVIIPVLMLLAKIILRCSLPEFEFDAPPAGWEGEVTALFNRVEDLHKKFSLIRSDEASPLLGNLRTELELLKDQHFPASENNTQRVDLAHIEEKLAFLRDYLRAKESDEEQETRIGTDPEQNLEEIATEVDPMPVEFLMGKIQQLSLSLNKDDVDKLDELDAEYKKLETETKLLPPPDFLHTVHEMYVISLKLQALTKQKGAKNDSETKLATVQEMIRNLDKKLDTLTERKTNLEFKKISDLTDTIANKKEFNQAMEESRLLLVKIIKKDLGD